MVTTPIFSNIPESWHCKKARRKSRKMNEDSPYVLKLHQQAFEKQNLVQMKMRTMQAQAELLASN